jgi:hypothetical protein
MRQIKLTKGKFALVDDEDFEWISVWKWHAIIDRGRWYAVRMTRDERYKRKRLLMHRLILGRPLMGIDHKDMDGLNNQKFNLRLCTHQENQRNRTKTSVNTSGYKGVSLDRRKYYRAFIVVNKKQVHLGTFPDKISAAKAYDTKAKELFGEFARLNFPQ